MSYLLIYWKKYWKLFILAVGFVALEACCDLLQPTIVSKIIDNGVKYQQMDYVIKMSLLMLLVTLVGAVGAVARNLISSRVSQRFSADLRADFYKKLYFMSYEKLGKFETASLITRLTNDITQLQNFCNGMMRIFIKAPILGIGAIIMVFFLNIRLALIMLVIIPIVVALIYLSLRIGYPYFIKLQRMLDRNNGVIREYLSGVRVVKAFNTFDDEVLRFKESNEALSDTAIKATRVMAFFTPLINSAVNFGIVFLLWNARKYVASSTIQVGQIIAFTNYMAQILLALNMIFNVYQQFIRAKASAERVGEVLTVPDDDAVNDNETGTLHGSIEYSNVTYRYPDTAGTPVLNNISFKLYPGETLGIIGSTGSAKTTLVNLLMRFYKPVQGNIYIDGVDINDFELITYREKISIVPQKVQLFTGTIADNIRWGKMDATDDDVIEAAKSAQAHDFIMSFPDGYNTLLGQNGVNLSGGQKQRISIARALIRKANILVLDDCVSAVDVNTEAKILNSIKKISNNLTCIMISQRISSVINFPKIMVLDEGSVVGIGTHDELILKCDIYREICDSQLGRSAKS